MNFKQAFRFMKDKGYYIQLPEWSGFWAWENNTIMMYCKDGRVLDIRETEDVEFTISNILREDWKLVDSEIEPNMKLKKDMSNTIDLMVSPDYKDRFKAEYLQLDIRIEGLSNMLAKYKNGTLPFEPTCSYELLFTQLIFMKNYRDVLKGRALIEQIDLEL